MNLRYLSLFSGIEAATEAWHPLGWECVGVSEIDPFGCALLAQRHPLVPNLGDVTKITEQDIINLGRIDLVVFGSPCQDLSVAGKRKGLDGARSGLFFTAMRIVGWVRKHCGGRFALWENVPGAFSSNKGLDFAAVVDELAGVAGTPVPPKGWGTEGCAVGEEAMVEWCVLDAQWAGVAQRRRRVFALADFGDWASRPPILLEPQGMRGDSPPSREAGKGVAGTLASRTAGGGFPGTDEACDGYVSPEQRSVLTSTTGDVAHCLNAGGMGRIDYESETMVISAAFKGGQGAAAGGIGYDEHVSPTLSSADSGSNRTPVVLLAFNSNAQADEMRFGPELSAALTCSQNSAVCFTGDITHALNTANNGKGSSEDGTGRGVPTIAYTLQHAQIGRIDSAGPQGKGWQADVAFTQDSRTSADAVVYGAQVRRLTPRECERLQGFPDDHTLVLSRGKPAADGPRYKALGNSMAVPVMGWIGRQIDFAWRFF